MSAAYALGTLNGAATSLLGAARARGVSIVDTARSYDQGRVEEALGGLLPRHPSLKVWTKVGKARAADGREEGLSRAAIVAGGRASKGRLGRVDVLFLHAPDREIPWEEPLDGLAELLAEGVIGGWGLSNFPAWEATRLVLTAERRGLPAPAAMQVLYNLLVRDAEREHLPLAAAFGIPVAAYNPLAGGLLARAPGETPRGARIAKVPLYRARYGGPVFAARCAEVAALGTTVDRTPLELAYGFLAARPVTVILGPKTEAHLAAPFAARPLSEEALLGLDSLAARWQGASVTATG